MVPSSRSIRQLTMSPAAQDCRKGREEVKHVFPGCSHMTRKTATQPIPRDSGVKKREFFLPAAHRIFRHFWKLHISPLTGIFFPSGMYIYPNNAPCSDVLQRTRVFQGPTAALGWESVCWGCQTKRPDSTSSTPEEVQTSAGTQTEAGRKEGLRALHKAQQNSVSRRSHLLCPPSHSWGTATHLAIVCGGHVPLAHPVSVVGVRVWRVPNALLHQSMREETQTRPGTEDSSHCKRTLKGETSRQGEQLTAHMLCLGKVLTLGMNPVACDLWFREMHHSLLIFGSEKVY